ncbi:polysaccharide lyase [Pyxidicoccus sp. 3LFB2]
MNHRRLTGLTLAVGLCTSAGAAELFKADYETGTFSQWGSVEGHSNEIWVQSAIKLNGNYAQKVTVLQSEYNQGGSSWRAEAVVNNGLGGKAGQTRWYGFSYYIPNDWVDDPTTSEVIWQLHEFPDACEDWRSPYLALYLTGNVIKLNRRYDSKPCSNGNIPEGSGTIASTPVIKGQWVDVVIKAQFSYTSTGRVQYWVNGQLVGDQTGGNIYNDTAAGYLKVGLYRWEWKDTTIASRTLYHDEVRVGDANSTYAEVAPRRGTPRTVLRDDFSVANNSYLNVNGGTWTVTGGQLQLTNAALPTGEALANVRVHTTPVSGDFTYKVDARATASTSVWDDFALVFNYQDAGNYSFASFNESNDGFTHGIFKYSNYTLTQLVDFSGPIAGGTFYPVEVVRGGGLIKVLLNGTLAGQVTDTSFTGGRVGVATKNNAATFDNLVVTQP